MCIASVLNRIQFEIGRIIQVKVCSLYQIYLNVPEYTVKHSWLRRASLRYGWLRRAPLRYGWFCRAPLRDGWFCRAPLRDGWLRRAPLRDGFISYLQTPESEEQVQQTAHAVAKLPLALHYGKSTIIL